jgi:hypothetical protein
MKSRNIFVFVTCCIIVLFGNTFLTAQNSTNKSKNTASASSSDKCFNESSRLFNVGVGLGYNRYYSSYRGRGYTYRSSPSFNISYEQAYSKKIGTGYLGLGGYLSYQRNSSKYAYFYDKHGYYSNYYYKNSWNNIIVAARAAYHLDDLNTKDGELYFGAAVGVRIQTYHYETNNPDPYADNYSISSGNIYPALSVFAGGRWYFSSKIAAFAEIGYGISYLNAGLTFKL